MQGYAAQIISPTVEPAGNERVDRSRPPSSHTGGKLQSFSNVLLNRTSSSSSSYSHFYVGSMYGDIPLHVAWSYTSSPTVHSL